MCKWLWNPTESCKRYEHGASEVPRIEGRRLRRSSPSLAPRPFDDPHIHRSRASHTLHGAQGRNAHERVQEYGGNSLGMARVGSLTQLKDRRA
eukprot:221299-Rhodomonas_salina.1